MGTPEKINQMLATGLLKLLIFPLVQCQFNYNPEYDVLVAETYQDCTYDEGKAAGCAPNANCFIINNTPTCHCIVDIATGLPIAGNPYRGCTWDMSGEWELRTPITNNGDSSPIRDNLTNQPVRIRVFR